MAEQEEIKINERKYFWTGILFVLLWFVGGMIIGAYIMRNDMRKILIEQEIGCWIVDKSGDTEFSLTCK